MASKSESSEKTTKLETKTEELIPAVIKPAEYDVQKAQEIIFQPNPGPQTDFLAATEQEVLYGGAAGGGKSFAMVADPVRYMNNPNFRGLLFRRTTDELRELKSVSKNLYPRAIPGIRWSERDSQWYAPSGATLWMTYLDKDDDVTRYQGQAFSWIGFDELTQWPTPYPWDYLRSRLRSADKSLSLYMRATTNPGGMGHSWVKKTFIDPAPWGKPFWGIDLETGEPLTFPKGHSREGEPLVRRRFIPAKLFDNPYLAEDGMYEANLLTLPEQQRKKLLEGNWDVAEGAAFTEWNRDFHIVDDFPIPDSWVKFRACDYGYSDGTCIVWIAVDPSTGQLIVYDEMYFNKIVAEEAAEMILDRERGHRIRYGILSWDLWNKRGDPGPSMAEQMIKKGCRWRPSDKSKGSRVAGKNELHRLLRVDENGIPGIVFFRSCLNCISYIPMIPLSKTNPEDVDTKWVHDHVYDALRYGIMSRPNRKIDWADKDLSAPSYRPADPTFGY